MIAGPGRFCIRPSRPARCGGRQATGGGRCRPAASGRVAVPAAVGHDPDVNLQMHRLNHLLNQRAGRALAWLVVAALLMGAATQFGFHHHADHGDGHGHHHAYTDLVDHHGQGGAHPDGDGDGDGDGPAAALHGHDFAPAAALTVADPMPCPACTPAARLAVTPPAPPDSRASAPPIRPPIA